MAYRTWLYSHYAEALDPTCDDFWWSSPTDAAPIKSKDGTAVPPRFAWLADITAFPNWSLFSHYFNVGVALNFLATVRRTTLLRHRARR